MQKFVWNKLCLGAHGLFPNNANGSIFLAKPLSSPVGYLFADWFGYECSFGYAVKAGVWYKLSRLCAAWTRHRSLHGWIHGVSVKLYQKHP